MALLPFVSNDPFFTEMDRQMNRMMQPIFGGSLAEPAGFSRAMATIPAFSGALFDVKETENAYSLIADTPGMTSDDIKVELSPDNSTLTISGEKKQEVKDVKKDKHGHVRYHRQERSFQKFTRSFALPEDAKPDSIAARLEHGVLTVDIAKVPKSEQPMHKARRIQVQAIDQPHAHAPAEPSAHAQAAATTAAGTAGTAGMGAEAGTQ